VALLEKSAGQPIQGGPLFCACVFFIGLISGQAWANTVSSTSVAHSGCDFRDTANAETVQIQSVTDGDTVVLSDSRRVRIIGINAPELDKPSERALKTAAAAAKAKIEKSIEQNRTVRLVRGVEDLDRYGRTLGHVILSNGDSVAASLLSAGLAAASAVAPNTRCATQYLQLEAKARQQQLGLWQQTNNPWLATHRNTNTLQGFHLLTDTVVAVTRQRKRWRLRLSGGAEVHGALNLLSAPQWHAMLKQTIAVRGWFSRRAGVSSVRLHHPSNLNILSQQ